MPQGVTGADSCERRMRCYNPSCNTWHNGRHEIDGEFYPSGLCRSCFIDALHDQEAKEAQYRERVALYFDSTGDERASGFLSMMEDWDNIRFNLRADPRYRKWFNSGVRAFEEWEREKEKMAVKRSSTPKITEIPGQPRRRRRVSASDRGNPRGD
jgi:hypothetical protein